MCWKQPIPIKLNILLGLLVRIRRRIRFRLTGRLLSLRRRSCHLRGYSRTCSARPEEPHAHGTPSIAGRRSHRSWGRWPQSIYQIASRESKKGGVRPQERSNSPPLSLDSESEVPPESACPSSAKSPARAPEAPAHWNQLALRSIHIIKSIPAACWNAWKKARIEVPPRLARNCVA